MCTYTYSVKSTAFPGVFLGLFSFFGGGETTSLVPAEWRFDCKEPMNHPCISRGVWKVKTVAHLGLPAFVHVPANRLLHAV